MSTSVLFFYLCFVDKRVYDSIGFFVLLWKKGGIFFENVKPKRGLL